MRKLESLRSGNSPFLFTMAAEINLISETEGIKSYRRDVIGVLTSHYATLSQLIQEETFKTFAEQAYSEKLIPSPVTDFFSVFEQFKASLRLCRSHLEIEQHCKCLTDILLELSGPVKVVGKQIEEKLTGK